MLVARPVITGAQITSSVSEAAERSIPAVVVSLLGVICIVALMVLPGAWMFAPVVVSAAVLFWIAICVGSARRGKFEGAVMVMVPPLLIGAMLLPHPSASISRWLADLVDITTYRGALLRQVDGSSSGTPNATIGVVAIDGFGSMTRGVAFDASRGLDDPSAVRDPKWRAALEATELSVPGTEIKHVVGAYYSWFHP